MLLFSLLTTHNGLSSDSALFPSHSTACLSTSPLPCLFFSTAPFSDSIIQCLNISFPATYPPSNVSAMTKAKLALMQHSTLCGQSDASHAQSSLKSVHVNSNLPRLSISFLPCWSSVTQTQHRCEISEWFFLAHKCNWLGPTASWFTFIQIELSSSNMGITSSLSTSNASIHP